ncbi:hypothetical protein C1H46_009864 [Malus baccata]|uniref:Uncharacterized protein n=1 Tax=Malus baccata TaxID=106549 RepID=A0A540N0H5_MALBA|nr:hypothetical protein C1H46_009864 [Malus baccata]
MSFVGEEERWWLRLCYWGVLALSIFNFLQAVKKASSRRKTRVDQTEMRLEGLNWVQQNCDPIKGKQGWFVSYLITNKTYHDL